MDDLKVADLNNICLDCISKNFERFHAAYNTSEDPHMLQNLKFLRKFHSVDILRNMTRDMNFNEKYLKFLVNEYLKDLEICLITSHRSSDSVVKRMAEVGHVFRRISFQDTFGTTESVNSIIPHLPNVNELYLDVFCTDETLRIVSATCVNLKELCLDCCMISHEGLKWLCRCTSLNVIIIYSTGGIEEGIAYLLKNMPSLEVLDSDLLPQVILSMHKEDIENNCLDSVQGYNLTTLNYVHAERDRLPVLAKLCPCVKKLSLSLGKEDVKLISSFSKLENLSASHDGYITGYCNIDNFLISSGGGMRELNLQNFIFSTCLLIEMCPNLEVLSLGCIHFLVTGEEKDVRKLNGLRKLRFEDMEFTDSSTQQSAAMLLSSAPCLERLDIIGCRMSDGFGEILANFCKNSRVEHVAFGYCLDVAEALLASILLSNACLQTLTVEESSHIENEEIQTLYSVAHSSKSHVTIIASPYRFQKERDLRIEALGDNLDEWADGYDDGDDF